MEQLKFATLNLIIRLHHTVLQTIKVTEFRVVLSLFYLLHLEPVFSPQTMLPQSAFRLKCILQHQSWNVDYSLDYSK